MFKRVKRADGFTLLELLVVMGILGILTSTSMLYFLDMLRSSRDTAALSDASSLIIVVNATFSGDESVDFTARNGQQLGVADAVGVARNSIFTLSRGVMIDFTAGFSNMCFGITSDNPGQFVASLYHSSGTPGREVHIWIDEVTHTQDFIVW